MTKEKNYESKVQNQFTAFLLSHVRGRRNTYIKKKINVDRQELHSEDVEKEGSAVVISFEEILETQWKEDRLLDEAQGIYPKWEELADEQLVASLLKLSKEERNLIYEHVFEERTFAEMARRNCMTEDRCKGVYYYAIRKIRKLMGGGRNEF